MRRNRAIAAALLALVFAVGGLAGMAVEEALGIDWFEFLDEDGRRGEGLLDDLGLTSEQKATAKQLLERQEDSLEAYWEARLPEINGILAGSYAEVRKLLTPEQQTKFDRRVRRLGSQLPNDTRDR